MAAGSERLTPIENLELIPREGIVTATVLAPYRITNEKLAEFLNKENKEGKVTNHGHGIDPLQIGQRTGIYARFAMQSLGHPPGELSQTVPNLATAAVEKVLVKKGWRPSMVDVLLAAHSYPYGESLAETIAQRLGATNCLAKDTNGACTGAVYALREFAKSGIRRANIVIVASEYYTRHLGNDLNRRLFSDGATAIAFALGEDVELLAHDFIIEENPAIRMPIDEQQIPPESHWFHIPNGVDYFEMDGEAVMAWLRSESLIKMVKRVHSESRPKGEIWIISHQASLPVLQILEEQRINEGINAPVTSKSLAEVGNMAAASVLGELDAQISAGAIKKGTVVHLLAFGAGLAAADVAIRINKVLG